MEPTYLGLQAVGWKLMLTGWWDKTIAAFLLASVILGTSYGLFRVIRALQARWQARRDQPAVSTAVLRYIKRLRRRSTAIALPTAVDKSPKSFGAYLGHFSSPPTPKQLRLLSQWDVIVLNPQEEGVLEAVATCSTSSTHVLGRLDLHHVLGSKTGLDGDHVVRLLEVTVDTLNAHFKREQDAQSKFSGILLAGFNEYFQPAVLNEFLKYVRSLGFDVWLEFSHPKYATEQYCRDVDMQAIRGVVHRNGTIRTDGDRQNYFQMEEMRTVMKAIAAQRVSHGPPTMMWETVDDDCALDYAVITRSFNWCRYNSALCWIGSAAALKDSERAADLTQLDKPLGALMWLKNDDNMKAHDIWRVNDEISSPSANNDALYSSLQDFIPDLPDKLRLFPPINKIAAKARPNLTDRLHSYTKSSETGYADPLATSATGDDFTGLGCFHLGMELSPDDFAFLLQVQRDLKDLDLLQRVDEAEMQRLAQQVQALHDFQTANGIKDSVSMAVDELLTSLTTFDDFGNPRMRIFVGLHSGFQTDSQTQVWGLYDIEIGSGVLNVYVSGRSPDRMGTVLHTFLSSRGCSRTECLVAEQILSEQNSNLSEKWQLPPRLVNDLEKLSPIEAIGFLQRLNLSKCREEPYFFEKIRECCQFRLVEIPTLTQLRALNSTAYLSNEVSPESLIESRIAWLQDQDAWHPDPAAAVALFKEVSMRLNQTLMGGDSELYSRISNVVQAIIEQGKIDAAADIFALAIFCAFRKLALDEITLEVLDRNPYPNHATDQAGCFAENFALGSRCDSFFDMTPRSLGTIISSRYRAYYMKHQPPAREEVFTELPTAYAAMQVDNDPADGEQIIPFHYRITFLGIFALPALIDIMSLTTLGRGLYLTTFMSSTEKTMATTALMLALLTCGAVGSWISSGASYYLYASAFPAMNMFVLTRFVAGIAIVLIAGVGGLIGISVVRSIEAALIFFYYFTMLTTYLMVLAALSVYQLPGSRFQSGRSVIMTCIPILFISPILSLWVQHDTAVYLCVLTVFLAALLFGARKTLCEWSSWYLDIPCVTDAEVLNWYTDKRKATVASEKQAMEMSDAEELLSPAEARDELHALVLKEVDRKFWRKSTTDPLVAKLAAGYSSTMFLMTWYCKYKRSRMPMPYSPTWNLTVKAGLENMLNMQKGLKLHSAFLHWRRTGSDIWSGILYFVVALLDKWVALVTGGGLVGLSFASSAEYRLAVGFGLCYYLIGAVSLDTVSQPLWTAANQKTVQPITSVEFLRQVTFNDAKARRKLYWTNLAKFFFLHIWGIAITSGLMWVFESSRNAVILYLAYLGAYTGLLWYQYNKIYCGTHAARSLAVASVIALPTGVAMHVYLEDFAFSGVTSLSVGTWIAAIHSLFLTKIGLPSFSRPSTTTKPVSTVDTGLKYGEISFFMNALEPCAEISQATLAKVYESLGVLPSEHRYEVDHSRHPGNLVSEILRNRIDSWKMELVQAAFPSSETLLKQVYDLWQAGQVTVEIVAPQHFPRMEHGLRTVSQKIGDKIHMYVSLAVETDGSQKAFNIHQHCQIIAESVVQVVLEAHLGFSHSHSVLAELLAKEGPGPELPVPEGVRYQLNASPNDRSRVLREGKKTLLRQLLLDVDCDLEWDNLPGSVRTFLLKRCCGLIDPLSEEEESWLRSRIVKSDQLDSEIFIARCNLAATLTVSINSTALESEASGSGLQRDHQPLPITNAMQQRYPPASDVVKSRFGLTAAINWFCRRYQNVQVCIKFLVLSLTADPEYQRELEYVLRTKPAPIKWSAALLNSIWCLCRALQRLIIPSVLFYNREKVARFHRNMKRMKTVMKKNRIVIESLNGYTTCFVHTVAKGDVRLTQYSGNHDQEPANADKLIAVNTYTSKLVLLEREEYLNKIIKNRYVYEYPEKKNGRVARMTVPLHRQCVSGESEGQIVRYDHRGYITTGSTYRGINPVQFTYWYRKNAKHEDELLRGEYVFGHITIRVNWSMPSRHDPQKLEDWIPFSKVTEATFIQGADTYHATWIYEHKFHPEIQTTRNGEPFVTPRMIVEDWFKVLEKPTRCGFRSDNPLLSFKSPKSNFLSRLLGLNTKRFPVPTSHARTQLWKMWKGGRQLDAITARWLDEGLLRSDNILRPYWRNRDLGRHEAAKAYLDAQADTIMARVDVDPEISSWVHVAFKMSDFYSFGQGGDSTINTRTMTWQMEDNDEELHILAMDTSTWPNEPGGVSACRRDMVNDLKTIKWHIVAESANDYGVPRFQIERNVQSLTVLPLWGLDFLNPTHGILENSLDSAVVQRSYDTKIIDIEKNFLPILISLVTCSRTKHLKMKHIEEATQALVDLNRYFESDRNWNDVWSSDIVKQTWRELWLTEEIDDALNVSQWWNFEKPTLFEMDQALNMWHRYLFIFSIAVPESIPDVFQASHHFTGATYGILCKVKRNCTLHVWDHCISFREFTTFMSSAVSFDSPFVNSSLISLGHLSCVLLEHHADVVLPCAAYFNPGWEVELGTAEGALEHRNTFARKIDPVVNGICNMEKFEPIKKIKTDKPTVVMLSHIQYVKDIKSAIMATDLIVNKWGFTDYSLHIYGDMERAAGHSVECQELIASKGLSKHCLLKGLGNPSVVLQDAWLFLNSSISEGLPLAMGEAALTGTPVVCTDVGASFCVVTDAETGDRFSEVCPPNDAESLARAQLSVLGLLGKWSEYAEDAPGTSAPVLGYPNPSPEQVKQISDRMYEKSEQRRRLGMFGRENVLKNFSSERYLREHEQMLWIGKYRSHPHRLRNTIQPSTNHSGIWFVKEKAASEVSLSKPRRNPRLTPESWVSLSRASMSSQSRLEEVV